MKVLTGHKSIVDIFNILHFYKHICIGCVAGSISPSLAHVSLFPRLLFLHVGTRPREACAQEQEVLVERAELAS